MNVPRRTAVFGGVLAGSAIAAAVLVGLSVGSGMAAPGPAQAPAPVATVMTELPGLTAATTETPRLDSLDVAAPVSGEVLQAAGPFDDRFELRDLGFDGTVVSGAVDVTSDVSELLELEVLVGFYDADGVLIGDGAFVLPDSAEAHAHGGVPEEVQAFDVPIPDDILGQARSAAVGVPVLVNE